MACLFLCSRCLQLLTRQCCPLCRRDFDPSQVRRLHTDKGSRSATPPPTASSSSESLLHAQRLLRRITRIVCEGALATEVRDLIEDVHSWLQTQGSEEHADLRSAHLLLFRYTELQRKSSDDKLAYADLQQTFQDLQERLRSERETADARYRDLETIRAQERDMAQAVEKSLREEYEKMDEEWNQKYEGCLAVRRWLEGELQEYKRTHRNPLPDPPRSVEPRFFYLAEKDVTNVEPMIIVKEDSLDSTNIVKVQIGSKEDMFRLSPVPPTLPIPSLPTTAFHPLNDESDNRDSDDGQSQKDSNNPYLLRSIQPLPIKPSLHRMSSNASFLSRYDDPMSRSLPQGSLDVHMASCSSSLNVSGLRPAPRGRKEDEVSGVIGAIPGSALGLRLGADTRRSSTSSQTDSHDQEQHQRERARAQLRELLNDPPSTSPRCVDSGRDFHRSAAESGPDRQELSPNVPSSATALSPIASGNASLQRSKSIWASEAAKAVERARASSTSSTVSPTSPLSVAHATAVKDRDTISPPSQSPMHSQVRPPYPRTMSTESLKAKAPSATASGLTRSLWAMQEVQGIS